MKFLIYANQMGKSTPKTTSNESFHIAQLPPPPSIENSPDISQFLVGSNFPAPTVFTKYIRFALVGIEYIYYRFVDSLYMLGISIDRTHSLR